MRTWTAGVDIGGTKIAAGLVGEDGVVISRDVRPTPRTQGAAGVLDAVSGLVSSLLGQLPEDVTIAGLGVGTGGVVDPDSGCVLSSTDLLPGWSGTRICAELQDRTGLRVAADNDVNAMALGEHLFGAGRAFRDAVYVAVGTGLGAGIVLGDRLRHGRHQGAGEIAHLPADPPGIPGRRCSCGRFGHLEAAVSGPALLARYRELAADSSVTALQDVVALADRGDGTARRVLADGATQLGRAMAGIAALLDPDAIVIGGGVSGAGPSFWGPLRSAWNAEGPRRAQLLRASLDSAAVVGAAWLARQDRQPAAVGKEPIRKARR